MPVEEVPATPEAGLRASELTPFPTTLSPTLLFVPHVTEIVAVTVLETEVVTLNVAVVSFAGTVTLSNNLTSVATVLSSVTVTAGNTQNYRHTHGYNSHRVEHNDGHDLRNKGSNADRKPRHSTMTG